MSRNGKISIIVIILAVITLIVVLSSTVFAVHNVKLVWYNQPSGEMSTVTEQNILDASKINGKSVFLLDKKDAIKNIESTYNRLRVIKLEVTWPNVVKIHAIQRLEVYAIKESDNKYLIVDEYFKVLDIVNTYNSTNINPVVFTFGVDKNYQVGDVVDFTYSVVPREIYNAFIALDQDIDNLKGLCKEIIYTDTLVTINTYFGITIKIDNPTQNTQAKMRMAIRTFERVFADGYGPGTIEVFINNLDELESRYY